MGVALVRRIDEADRYRYRVDGGWEGDSKASPLTASTSCRRRVGGADNRDDEGVALAGAVREKVLRKRYHRRWFERVNNEMVDTVLRVNNSIYLQKDDDRERKAEKES